MPHSTSQSSVTLRQRIAAGKYRLGRLGESVLEWTRRHRELTAGILLVLAYLVLVRFLHQPITVLPVLVVAALAFYFFNRYPFAAFIGLIAVIHIFNYTTVAATGTTLSFLYGIFITGLIVMQSTVRSGGYRKLLRNSFDMKWNILILYVCTGVISIALNAHTMKYDFSELYAYSHVLFIVIYFIVGIFIDSEKRLYNSMLAILYFRALDGIYGLYLFTASPDSRIGGTFSDPNEYACYSLLALPIALFLFRSTKSLIVRISIVISSIFVTIAVLISSSRAAFITMIALGIIIMFSRSLELRSRIIGFLIVVVIFLALATGLYWHRIESIETVFEGEGRDDNSIEIRVRVFNEALDVFLLSPVYGSGYGQFTSTTLEKHGGYSRESMRFATHNTHVRILAEHGLLGFIPYVLFIFLIIRDGYRAARDAKKAGDINLSQLATGANLALITILIMGFMLGVYGKQMFFYFGLVAATHRVVRNKLRSKEAADAS